jgi:hypothetical protein
MARSFRTDSGHGGGASLVAAFVPGAVAFAPAVWSAARLL